LSLSRVQSRPLRQFALRPRSQTISGSVAREFRFALRTKKRLHKFISIGQVSSRATVGNVRTYDFDLSYRLRSLNLPERGDYKRDPIWSSSVTGTLPRKEVAQYAAAIALACILWFALIGERRLSEPDEGRYAEIAREMALSGDWVTPRLNDLVYLEKPPLQYWTTAAAFKLFGTSEWAARAWCAVTGLAGILLVYYAGLRLHSRRAGLDAAAMLASSGLYFAAAHFNTLDMGVTFFMTAALLALIFGWRAEATAFDRKLWIHIAWAAAGLAVLSKGLIGIVLPGAAVMCYSLLFRDWTIWRKFAPATGVPLFLLVTVPWFIAVSIAQPDFPYFFFVHEHFARFLTTEHNRYEPWWFFLPVLAIGALPWTFPMLRGWWRALARRESRTQFQPFRLLAVWCAVVFVFFSASDSKLVSYIVPIFPALALLAARDCSEMGEGALVTALRWCVIIGALAVVAAVFAPIADARPLADLMRARRQWLIAGGALFVTGAALAVFTSRRARIELGLFTVTFFALAAYQLAAIGFDQLAPVKSSAVLAAQLKSTIAATTPVYCVYVYPQSLPFYLGRTVIPVAFTGELAFGLEREPQKGIADVGEFVRRWRAETDAVAVMPRSVYLDMRGAGVPMRVIGEDPMRVAVRR
jgi:4-amino-4-deoxy-L-arabinose transferase-like glycosyltransferase